MDNCTGCKELEIYSCNSISRETVVFCHKTKIIRIIKSVSLKKPQECQ